MDITLVFRRNTRRSPHTDGFDDRNFAVAGPRAWNGLVIYQPLLGKPPPPGHNPFFAAVGLHG